MAGEDIWSLLTRRLYPSGGDAGTRTHDAKDDPKHGADAKEEGGEDGKMDTDDMGADKEGGVTPVVSACTSYALCVGMPGAGKSSLLNAYLNPNNDDIPKPTVALEYMFARRASVANSPKDVAHIWELGGGSHVSDLVRVPITPERFHHALYVIVVDLSKPSSVIPHLLHWTDQIKACVKVCVRELGKRDPTFAGTLKKKTYAKLGRDHPDLRAVRPCPVPLVVVGNKYDIFKNHESVRRRTLSQALRFIAHINGASLLFCSSKEKRLKEIFRVTLNTHLFRSSSRTGCETNPEKPLVVPAGSDSLDAILKATPQGTRREDFVSGGAVTDGAMKVWTRAVEDVFGAADAAGADELPVSCADGDQRKEGRNVGDKNPFPEAAVDEHRAQRDEVLRRYRKDAERKAKLTMKTADLSHRSGSRAPSLPVRRSSRSSSEAKGGPTRK